MKSSSPLQKCREHCGLSLVQLAEKCHTTRSTLQRIEKGSYRNPSGQVCYRILKQFEKYGLTLEHLIYPERFPDFVINK
ncbi:helix-turn-helix transcriptional regulator [Vibrio parahaemolyticus]|nr:helix-turn-helix transcriptional regulator [Vibrio parahaemolyticus]EIO2938067.1 helix-turn-helix transcriptional regulator [Vibrio parahaemolyticus]